MQIVLYIIIALPLIYLGVLLGFYFLQDFMIFRGSRLHPTYRFKFDEPFKEETFTTKEGIELNTLLFQVEHAKGVIFYNHGNTGHMQYWGTRVKVFLELGYEVFMYDYRGYGKSTGSIKNERQMHKDANFLYQQLLSRYHSSKIIIYGISLGTGVACKLASKKQCKSLILETPYYNFIDVIGFHYPLLPVRLISKYKFRTNFFIRKVKHPVYLIHGTKDEMIDYHSSVRLKEKFPKAKLVTVENGGHSDLPEFESYRSGLIEALEAV